MLARQSFGGDWTEEKLNRVRKYLSAYTTIMKDYPYFRTAYIDAFAGTGYRELKDGDSVEPLFPELLEQETQRFARGSAQIALEVQPRFTKYIFIEKDPTRYAELERLRADYPELADDILPILADCNSYLQDLCKNRNWERNRAVLFLDPFGMQVEWRTIEAVAKTGAIDLWLLFPLGVAVSRILRRDGQIDELLSVRLDNLFGTTDWYAQFYESETQATLFGQEERLRKTADFNKIKQFFISRLKTTFPSVAENPLALRNSKNVPLYLLCFAAGNPKGGKTAVKIAQDILGD